MKIGLFGGSFNPIHKSHVKIFLEVLEKNLVDEVWIIPCYSHNFGKDLTSFEDRKKMIELALGNLERVRVCEIEKELGGISRTYDTIIELKKRFEHNFFWICGGDCIVDFDKWYRARDLAKEMGFIVYAREGFDFEDFEGKILSVLNTCVDNISSSEIRVRIKNGDDVLELVPEKIFEYINEKGFYRK